jgi:hypothetical protein
MCHFFWQQRCMLGLLHYSVVVWMKGTLIVTFYSSLQAIVCTERQKLKQCYMYSWAVVGACMQTLMHIQNNSPFLSQCPLFSLLVCSTVSVYLSVCLYGDSCIWKHFFGMCEWPFPPENFKCICPCYMSCLVLLHIYYMPKGNTLQLQATLG